jgi:thioredoxin 1
MSILAKLENEWNELLSYEGLVLINCHALWCISSQDIILLVDQLAEKYKDRIKVIKVDIDKNPKVAHNLGLLGINSIPITFIFKCGNLVGEVAGMAPYEAFCNAISSHLHNENSMN